MKAVSHKSNKAKSNLTGYETPPNIRSVANNVYDHVQDYEMR